MICVCFAQEQWLCVVHMPVSVQVIKNKIRGVNMKGFGYGGEDAYFYASGQ